jgi:hypothetical protein
MLPDLPPGTIRVVTQKPYNDLVAGEVALRWDGNRWIGHELIFKRDDSWVMRGSANKWNDLQMLTKSNYGGVISKKGP